MRNGATLRGVAGAPGRAPLAVLAAAMAISAAYLLWLTRGTTFAFDEWLYFAAYPDFDDLLNPDHGNLVLLPVLYYKAGLALFETSYLPYRLLSVALTLLCAGLVYRIAQSSIGPWAALVPAIVLLFLGAAWDVLVGPVGLVVAAGLACMLGALLALEARSRAGDLAALVLVAAGLASFSNAAALCAGLLVLILLQGGDRRRLLVVLGPLALWFAWCLWSLGAETTGAGQVSAGWDGLGGAPFSLAESLATGAQSLAGAYAPGQDSALDVRWGWPIAVLLALLAALRLARGPRLSNRGWALAAMLAAYWLSFALLDKNPTAARYQFTSGALLLLLAAEMLAGVRLKRGMALGLVGALVANVAQLHHGGEEFRDNARLARAKLAGLELIRGDVDPEAAIQPLSYPEGPGTISIYDIRAGQYFEAVESHGSLALPLGKLVEAPADERHAADKVMYNGLRLVATRPVEGLPRTAATPRHEGSGGAKVERRGNCWRFAALPGQTGSLGLVVPPGGLTVRAGADHVSVQLRRFGDDLHPSPTVVEAGRTAAMDIPPDRSRVPWRAFAVTAGSPRSAGLLRQTQANRLVVPAGGRSSGQGGPYGIRPGDFPGSQRPINRDRHADPQRGGDDRGHDPGGDRRRLPYGPATVIACEDGSSDGTAGDPPRAQPQPAGHGYLGTRPQGIWRGGSRRDEGPGGGLSADDGLRRTDRSG